LPNSIKKAIHETFCPFFEKWFFSVQEHNISPQELCFRDYQEEKTGILAGYKVRQSVGSSKAQVIVGELR
jgi:hypothetical protein